MRYIFILSLICPLILLSLFIPQKCCATATQEWRVSSQEEFLKGKGEGISIDFDGKITLAPAIVPFFETKDTFVWTVIADNKGNLYAGTGDEGKVFKIDPNGKGELLFDSTELEILSLCLDKKGNLYAGTAPSGLIYKIQKKGIAELFYTTGEKYVWAMLFDDQDNLIAATGPGGKIFRISKNGEGEVFYQTSETNVMCLYLDGAILYAGGSGKGFFYRIEGKDKGMVLFDPPQTEVRNIVKCDDGFFYISTVPAEKSIMEKGIPGISSGGNQSGTRVEVSFYEPAEVVKTLSAKTKPEEIQSEEAKLSILYRISSDGFNKKVWISPENPIYSLSFDGEKFWAGCGEKGSLYTISPEGKYSRIATSFSSGILHILAQKQKLYLSGGEKGTIYKIDQKNIREGFYISEVFDAGQIAKWGNLKADAVFPEDANITLQIRRGNSAEPDASWSNWSGPAKACHDISIGTPASRFLQWKAILKASSKGMSPQLNRVKTYYLIPNKKPEITAITIYPRKKGILTRETAGGKTFTQEFPSGMKITYSLPTSQTAPTSGKWVSVAGYRTVSWEAKDEDKDQLEYKVFLKKKEDKSWRMLAEKLSDTFYSFDTSALVDGWYLIKIIADDSKVNPVGTGLTAELESEPFYVDNTPPVVEPIKAEYLKNNEYKIAFIAKDDNGIIVGAQFSLDTEDWKILFPADEIFDAKMEDFSFLIKVKEKGMHTISVQVVDEDDNVGVGRAEFEAK